MPPHIPVDDFSAFWAAGRLTRAGGDPYDLAQLLTLERQAGWPEPVLPVWHPPWVLPLHQALAGMPYPVARVLWAALSAVALVVAAELLWRTYAGRPSRPAVVWSLALLFPPVLHMLAIGQAGAFVVLGLALFLRYQGGGRAWAAAAGLGLASGKPHLLLPFFAAGAAWMIVTRRLRLAAWTVGLPAAALALVSFQSPGVVTSFLALLAQTPPTVREAHGASEVLGRALGLPGLRWLVAAGGIAWAVLHYWRRRRRWDWAAELPPLVVVSLLCAPFSWGNDAVLLLIPVLARAAALAQAPPRAKALAVGLYLAFAPFWVLPLVFRVPGHWLQVTFPALFVLAWWLSSPRAPEAA